MVAFGINAGGDFVGTSGAATATRTGGIPGTGTTTRLFVTGHFTARVYLARLYLKRLTATPTACVRTTVCPYSHARTPLA